MAKLNLTVSCGCGELKTIPVVLSDVRGRQQLAEALAHADQSGHKMHVHGIVEPGFFGVAEEAKGTIPPEWLTKKN